MEQLQFSEDEIKRQLAALGYFNVPEERMKQFRKDLHRLIEHDRSASGSSSWYTGVSSPSTHSETSDFSTKPETRPQLSRFQPHIKVPPRLDSAGQSSRQTESSWLAQSDINRIPSKFDYGVYKNYKSHKPEDTSSTTSEALASLTLEEENRLRLHQDEITSKHPVSFQLPLTNTETSTAAEENSSVENDKQDMLDSNSDTKLIRKRKVLRKQLDGTPRIYDESLVEDSTRGIHRIHDISVDDSDPRLSRVTPEHYLPPRPHSTKPTLWKKDSSCEMLSGHDHLPSYIRPNTAHPHTHKLKKTDPVNRYHQYRDFWTNIKAPGEKSHKNLRWEVKAQMMYKEEPAPKTQRVYVPNTYVVPTSKKRSALRWEVRHAMETGLPLPTTYDVY